MSGLLRGISSLSGKASLVGGAALATLADNPEEVAVGTGVAVGTLLGGPAGGAVGGLGGQLIYEAVAGNDGGGSHVNATGPARGVPAGPYSGSPAPAGGPPGPAGPGLTAGGVGQAPINPHASVQQQAQTMMAYQGKNTGGVASAVTDTAAQIAERMRGMPAAQVLAGMELTLTQAYEKAQSLLIVASSFGVPIENVVRALPHLLSIADLPPAHLVKLIPVAAGMRSVR